MTQMDVRDWKNWAGIVLAPFLVQAVLVAIDNRAPLDQLLRLKEPLHVFLATSLVSVGIGFIFLIRELRWYSLIVGIAYLPGMAWLLFYFTFAFNAAVFGAP